MPTPTTKTTTENLTELTNEVPVLARKFRDQLLSNLQQSQKLSVDAAQTWVKAVSVLPVKNLPKLPSISAIPTVETATKYTFDVAGDVLGAQREFALQLANTFVPAKTS